MTRTLSQTTQTEGFFQPAIIPHPISTPTALGIIALTVGITLPTVDPIPT
jgi:hypothetical protein